MRSHPFTARFALIGISIIIFFILAGSTFPSRSESLQAEASPTPTPTQILVGGEPVLQSGDTEGLIIGAAVILAIIVGGVFIQRLLRKKDPSSPSGKFDSTS